MGQSSIVVEKFWHPHQPYNPKFLMEKKEVAGNLAPMVPSLPVFFANSHWEKV